ncbi:MAG: N-formylglutamate amidohydrolase [Hyphomicrobiaceae bacterium]|nr:N-formylglutamate amidohydrolase [Hyphomicrobiaceae bacterium]
MPERERASIIAELTPPFEIHRPEAWSTPFVFCSPHSGRIYPRAFLEVSRLDAHTLRRSEDCYVDELFRDVTELGAPLIAAKFPRAYLDVNREPYELDPELFSQPLPDFANTQTMRVIGGLGTIARVVSETDEIYDQPITLAAAFERIDRLYRPFHAALQCLLEEARQRFGYAVLVDCHSMPSASISQPLASRPDFVIGDRFGVSCDPRFVRELRGIAKTAGYHTQLNRPYAGGYITEHYGRPQEGIHALQIEINRGLYLNERSFERGRRFDSFRRDIIAMSAALIGRSTDFMQPPAAAE